MSKNNTRVAELLRKYAGALAVEGANRFKLKAYRQAAETIEELDTDVAELVRQGADLTELPGIGKAISAIITEIIQSGTLTRLDKSLSKLPSYLVEIAARPLLDPAKVKRIYKKLGIGSLAELKKSLEAGEIGARLGPRMEYHVRQGLDDRPRSLRWNLKDIAARFESVLASLPGVVRVSTTGSFRRKQDTVCDLGFLVATKNSRAIFKRFTELGGVIAKEPHGPGESVFKMSSGLSIVVRCTSPQNWGMALVRATGSALHVTELERRAARRRIPFSPEALVTGKTDFLEETTVYASLGLDFVEPELREGLGEVAAAARGKLPTLVEARDLRGDLHMHTTASDGADTLEAMANAARARGYRYIAITDHSQSLHITNGLSEERLLEQIRIIDRLNARLDGLRILKSAEVDILADGKLDYSDAVLKELDCTICSIHSRFGLNKEQQTERILRAMDNRYFTVLGHATGRLLLKRPGYQLDMERLFEHANAVGCFFEINSSPDRVDLSDVHARAAKECGLRIAINTDAHSVGELDFIAAGIDQARRAWLEPADVLNALPMQKLLKVFRR